MASHRDFGAARAEAEGDALTFTLAGTEFTCAPVLTLGPLVDLADKSHLAGPEAVATFRTFLEAVVVEEGAVAAAVNASTYAELVECVRWIVEETIAVPTMPASGLPSPQPKAGASSRNGSRSKARS